MKKCEIGGCNNDGWNYIYKSIDVNGKIEYHSDKWFLCREHYYAELKIHQDNPVPKDVYPKYRKGLYRSRGMGLICCVVIIIIALITGFLGVV